MANIFYDYVLDELRLKDVPDGSGGFYGSFYDTTTHTVASTTTAYPITLNTTVSNNGVSIGSPTSRIVFDYAGIYSITFSVQYENTDNQAHASTIWLRKNGTDVPDSSSYISVPSSHGGTNGKILTTVNYVLDLNANDYIEVYYQAENTDIQIVTIPAGTTPTTPVSPSIILTAVQGGIITQGSTTNSLASLTDVSFTSLASGQIIMSNASGNWGNVNFPAIPSIPSLGSLAVLNTLDYSALTGKPSLGSLAVLNSLSYTSLSNLPSLGSLAILNDLSYTSLLNLPSLGSLAVLNDLSYTSLLNLPSLGSLAVLNSLSFTSLLNQPSLSSLAYQSTVDYVTQVTSKPSLGSLAPLNSLSYGSILNTPSLGSLAVLNDLSYTSLLNLPSLGSLAVLNDLSYTSLLNLPSLGSLAVMNQLSFTSLTNQPSLSSLAFQSTIDYTSAQLTNKPSLGSLAPLDAVTQTYLPSSASFSILTTNGIVNASTVSTYQLNAYKATATLLSLGSTGNEYGRLQIINNFDADTNNLYPYGIFQQTIDTDLFGYDSFGGYFESIKKVGANTTVFGHRARGFFSPSAVSQTLQGLQATSNQIEVKNYGTVNFAETLTTNATVENSTIGELRLLRLYTPTLSGNATINALYGAFIANTSIVANNYAIYSEGGNSYHEGSIFTGVGHLAVNNSNLTPLATGATGDILAGNGNANFQYDASTAYLNLEKSISNAQGIDFAFYKSRGNTASPSIVTAGDDIGLIRGYAYQASAYTEVTRITLETLLGGATNSGVIRFYTANAGTLGERVVIREDGDVGIGITTPTAKLHVDQSSSTANIPVVSLDQADSGEPFINYIGVSSASSNLSIWGNTTVGTLNMKVRISVNGIDRWMYLYTN